MPARIFLLFAVAVLAGCASSQEKAMDAIKEQEATLYTSDTKNFKFDPAQARATITAYETFAQQYPQSKDAPEMLLKSADLHRSLKEYDAALNLYQKIATDFPAFDKLAQTLFLQAFVYENELYRLEKAKALYEEFLQKYPDHDLADDVQFSLQNLGKTPEEIIKGFEQQEAAPTDTSAS
ncbi:MAG: tetratricopeptide repeat protein [Chitinophagales bacterium]|mgnify:CR=1 FL=1|nr:tetratricopeptide repeat protein [Chitinophagales bacterium]